MRMGSLRGRKASEAPLKDKTHEGGTTTMKRVIGISLALVMVLSALALADGSNAFSAFKSGIGARALAMGGAFVAVADDATAVSWNPAGLSQLNDTRIGGMTGNLFGMDGYTHQFIGAVTTFSNLGIGLAWERAGLASGTEPLTDESGNPIAGFEWNYSSIIGTLSTNIMDIGLAGANVKYYMGQQGSNSGSGFGFDLGVLINLGNMFTIGVSAGDIGGSKVTWTSNAGDTISGLYKAGVALKLADGMLVLATDLDFDGTKMGDAHVGLEFKVIKELALRAGAVMTNNFKDAYFTVGGGINVAGLYVDAAYILRTLDAGVDGSTLVLSAEFSLGDLLGGGAVKPVTTPTPAGAE